MGEADHYRTLGLRRDATKAEIKAAFSRLALLHHPDRHARADAATRADASRRFRQAYDAYHVLYDDRRRAEYDLRSSSPWSSFCHGSAKSRSSSSSPSGHGSAESRSSSASGHGSAKPSPSLASSHGSAKARSSSPSGRYGYRYGRGGDFPDWQSPGETESLGVWVKANWYPLLCCTVRVAEVIIDCWKMYNTCKSWWQSSTEKEAEESEEKMKNEPSEEKK